MALAFANLGVSANPDINTGTDGTSAATASWVPPASGLICAFVWTRSTNGHIQAMSGNGITWHQIATVQSATVHRLTLFAANASGSTTGATTISIVGGDTAIGFRVSFLHVTGVDLTGGVAAAFVQAPTNQAANVATLSVNLAAAGNAANRAIAGFAHAANEATTPRTNWTELDDLATGAPNNALETQYRGDAFETTASASWASSVQALGIAAEIKAALTVFTQSVGGTVSPAGTVTKKTRKVVAGSIAPAGALFKKTKKVLGGSLTAAGAIIKKTRKVLGGSLTGAGSLAAEFVSGVGQVFQVAVGGTITAAGSLTKKTRKTLAGSLAAAGAVTKQTRKVLAGSLAPAGAVLKSTRKKLAGLITPASSVIKITRKALAGSLAPAGTVFRTTFKRLAGSVTPAGTVLKRSSKALAGSITPSGALAKMARKALSGTIAPAGSLTKMTFKRLAGILTPAGSVLKKTYKVLSGLLAAVGSLLAGLAVPEAQGLAYASEAVYLTSLHQRTYPTATRTVVYETGSREAVYAVQRRLAGYGAQAREARV